MTNPSAGEGSGKPRAAPGLASSPKPLFLCLSHLRWAFVFQRPQHLLSRAARSYEVVYVEEPVFEAGVEPHWTFTLADGVRVATPNLPEGLAGPACNAALEALVERLLGGRRPALLWYYTPMALEFSRAIGADVTVYDNMDELSLFHGADSRIVQLEGELMARADVVFTGGQSLYEAKRDRHPNIHAVPSSVDTAHFARDTAAPRRDPADQAHIPHPRAGFFGVIDERMDMELLDSVAQLRPDVQFVMIGPVVKIAPESRPMRPNIHWLGGRHYNELPDYMHNWDVGFMPFAINDSTRFISPTKTPEFLAAGLPVVSTPIRDVIHPYGARGLVEIAATPEETAAALDRAMASSRSREWRSSVVEQLALSSWDRTWAYMAGRVEALTPQKETSTHA